MGIGYELIQKRGLKEYELTNHLGNVLATLTDKKLGHSSNDSTVDYYNADVVSAQDYYPFGMLQPGREFNEGKYRYGFNGKENDNEVKGEGNQQDYGMRIYDPRLGKFLSVDPISKSYPWYTPYQFAGNSPIQATDLDGLEEYHYTMTLDKQGNAHLSKPTVREFQDHNILGIHFKTEITPERYIVTFQNKNYYIGYAGTMKGWGNEWGRKLFNLWKGDGSHVNAQMFTALFYNEEDSKRGKLVDDIESIRRYYLTGAKDALAMQLLGIGYPVGFAEFKSVQLKDGEKGGKQINSEIKKIANGQGTPRLDENGNQTLFTARNDSKMQQNWNGALEYEVSVPGESNRFRILKKQTGADDSGNPVYKYGWTKDHYETIYEFQVADSPKK